MDETKEQEEKEKEKEEKETDLEDVSTDQQTLSLGDGGGEVHEGRTVPGVPRQHQDLRPEAKCKTTHQVRPLLVNAELMFNLFTY